MCKPYPGRQRRGCSAIRRGLDEGVGPLRSTMQGQLILALATAYQPAQSGGQRDGPIRRDQLETSVHLRTFGPPFDPARSSGQREKGRTDQPEKRRSILELQKFRVVQAGRAGGVRGAGPLRLAMERRFILTIRTALPALDGPVGRNQPEERRSIANSRTTARFSPIPRRSAQRIPVRPPARPG